MKKRAGAEIPRGVTLETGVIRIDNGHLSERRRDFRTVGWIGGDDEIWTMGGMLIARPADPDLALMSETRVELYASHQNRGMTVMSTEHGHTGDEMCEALADDEIAQKIIWNACNQLRADLLSGKPLQ